MIIGKNGTRKNWARICENGSKETRLMTLPLTMGTRVEGNGTGTQRENRKMAMSLEPPLACTVKVTTGKSLWSFQHLRKKKAILSRVEIVLKLWLWGSWSELLLMSPLFQVHSRNTTRPCGRPLLYGPTDGIVFTTYNLGSDCYQPSFCWRFRE